MEPTSDLTDSPQDPTEISQDKGNLARTNDVLNGPDCHKRSSLISVISDDICNGFETMRASHPDVRAEVVKRFNREFGAQESLEPETGKKPNDESISSKPDEEGLGQSTVPTNQQTELKSATSILQDMVKGLVRNAENSEWHEAEMNVSVRCRNGSTVKVAQSWTPPEMSSIIPFPL